MATSQSLIFEPKEETTISKDRELLFELEKLETLERSRKKTNGLVYYTPNVHQMKAHQSEARIVLVCGANRIGKSTLGAVELATHLTRKYPDYWSKRRRFYRPIKAVIVCDALQKIEKVIEPKLFEFLPFSLIEDMKRITGGYLNRIRMKDGATVDFLSAEQDQMSFEGADWDFYWGDEPQRKRQFEAIQRGLVDRNGITVLTFTPLVEPWMKEDLIDKSDGKKIEVITASMYDNQYDIKGHSILSKESIEEYENSLSDDMKETRIYGKFFHLRGAVYPEFGEMHKIEFSYQYPDPVIAVLDPHDRQNHHVIWAIIDRNEDIFVHSELSVHCPVNELTRLIKIVEEKNGYRMRRRLIDPNFGRKPLITTGRNFIQEMAFCGLGGWQEANDSKDEGRLKVKEYLFFHNKLPISHTNKPKLFFHRFRTPLTIHSIANHQYEEWIGKLASERDPKEKSKDQDTHGADDVRYLCMSNPTHGKLESRIYELEESPY